MPARCAIVEESISDPDAWVAGMVGCWYASQVATYFFASDVIRGDDLPCPVHGALWNCYMAENTYIFVFVSQCFSTRKRLQSLHLKRELPENESSIWRWRCAR